MIDPNRICMNCMKELQDSNICPHCAHTNGGCVNAAHQLPCGSILAGAYLVGRVLGQGGFGITYIGYDLNLNIRVAIKEYFPNNSVTRDIRTRSSVLVLSEDRRASFEEGKDKFVNEARTLAQFSGNKGIVGVRSFFHENGTAYIVMDFIEGQTLKTYVARRGGRLPADEVLKRMEALFEPLMRMHKAGLMHRDISPDNIMLTKDDSLVLLDFGSTRQISASGEHSNTINVKLGFAPEEQYRTHGEQGPWTDVYALCATIYRLTTGVTPPDALDRATNDLLQPPNLFGAGLSDAQERALMHGLAVRAQERTADLKELHEELYGGKIYQNKQLPPILSKPIQKKPMFTRPIIPARWSAAVKQRMPYIALGILILAGVIGLIAAFGEKPDQKMDASGGTSVQATRKTQEAKATAATPRPTQKPTQEPEEATQVPTKAPTATPFQLSSRSVRNGIVAASIDNTLLLKSDGTVICLGSNDINTTGWKNIVQLAATGYFAVGLQSGGTLVGAGDLSHHEDDFYGWRDVVQVDCGYQHVAAVTSDGSVYYAGTDKHGRSSCRNWSRVARVLAGSDHLAAILEDGTVVAAGYSAEGRLETGSFREIVAGDVGGGTTFCVMSDGTVLATGANFKGEDNVWNWTNIVAIAASGEHTVGLRTDGTVIATGVNDKGQCDVEGWRDIVAIAAGGDFTVGVRADGSVVATGSNDKGQINVSGIRLW